jgi:hypothetical protein
MITDNGLPGLPRLGSLLPQTDEDTVLRFIYTAGTIFYGFFTPFPSRLHTAILTKWAGIRAWLWLFLSKVVL